MDPVDLRQALRTGPGLRGRGAGELVSGPGHRPRQRRGDRRKERARRSPGGADAHASVDAAHHPLRGAIARGSGGGRLAGSHREDAAGVDREIRGRAGRVPGGGSRRRGDRDLHHPFRHPLRRHLHGAGARASARREDHQRRGPGRRGRLCRRHCPQERAFPAGRRRGEDRSLHRRLRRQSRQRRAHPHLDRRLRPGRLRNRRHHGRPRPRRARLRLRQDLRPAHRGGGDGRRPLAGGLRGSRHLGELQLPGRPRDAGRHREDEPVAGAARARAKRPSATSCGTGSSVGSATGASPSP